MLVQLLASCMSRLLLFGSHYAHYAKLGVSLGLRLLHFVKHARRPLALYPVRSPSEHSLFKGCY